MRIKNFFNFSKKKEAGDSGETADLKKYNLVIKYIFSDVNNWNKNRVNPNPLLYKSNLKIEEFANLLDYGIDQDSFLEYRSSYYIDSIITDPLSDDSYDHRVNLNINELDRSENFLRLAYFLMDELDISTVSVENLTGAYGRRTGYALIAKNLSKKDIDSISKMFN